MALNTFRKWANEQLTQFPDFFTYFSELRQTPSAAPDGTESSTKKNEENYLATWFKETFDWKINLNIYQLHICFKQL